MQLLDRPRGPNMPGQALPVAIEPFAGVDARLPRVDALLQQRGDARRGRTWLLRRRARGHDVTGRRQPHNIQDAERPERRASPQRPCRIGGLSVRDVVRQQHLDCA